MNIKLTIRNSQLVILFVVLGGCRFSSSEYGPSSTYLETPEQMATAEKAPVNQGVATSDLTGNDNSATMESVIATTVNETGIQIFEPDPDFNTRINEFVARQDTQDCRLPCWWGINPGQTTWPEALEVFESLVKSVYYETYGASRVAVASTLFQRGKEEIGIRTAFEIEDSKVKRIGISGDFFSSITDVYIVQNVLSEYGVPDEVRIDTSARIGDGLFHYFLFYENQGILFVYLGFSTLRENKVRLCTSEETYPYLLLWSPAENTAFEKIIETGMFSFSSFSPERYPLIQDISIMFPVDFAELVLSSKGEYCFDTEYSIWFDS